jgi:hypothetical protein
MVNYLAQIYSEPEAPSMTGVFRSPATSDQ